MRKLIKNQWSLANLVQIICSLPEKLKLKYALLITFVLMVGGFYKIINTNPLPHDEVMLEYFYKHRVKIDELLQSFRDFKPDSNTKYWEQLPRAQQLIKELNIFEVTKNGPNWFDDLYSIEAAKKNREKNMNGIKTRTYNPIRDNSNQPTEIFLNGSTKGSFKFLPLLSKSYVYYPSEPKIDGDFLLYPADPDGKPGGGLKVLSSLNDYPSEWKHGECFLRKIEPQWFIKMCRSW